MGIPNSNRITTNQDAHHKLTFSKRDARRRDCKIKYLKDLLADLSGELKVLKSFTELDLPQTQRVQHLVFWIKKVGKKTEIEMENFHKDIAQDVRNYKPLEIEQMGYDFEG